MGNGNKGLSKRSKKGLQFILHMVHTWLRLQL